MSNPDRIIAPQQLLTKAQAKEEFGLTESHLVQIGEPDATKPNPHYRKGAPVRLYSRQRVERWVAEHQEVLAKSEIRRRASQKAVETKGARSREQVTALVRELKLRPAPRRERLVVLVGQFLFDRYGNTAGEVSERAICSYIRHRFTNYEAILESVKGKVGVGDLYTAVKVYLCCKIIRRYHLDLDPLVAAFGSRDDAPDAFLANDPEQASAQLLGLVRSERESR